MKSGVSELPEGVGWRHVYGAGWLAGIGVTMSLFITNLAFSDASLANAVKIGILVASPVAGVAGWTILRGPPTRARRRTRRVLTPLGPGSPYRGVGRILK